MLRVHSVGLPAGADAVGVGGPTAALTGAFPEWCEAHTAPCACRAHLLLHTRYTGINIAAAHLLLRSSGKVCLLSCSVL